MQHFWFRVLDIRALRRARVAVRAGPARIFADTVAPEVSAALARKSLPPGTFEVLLASMAVEDERGCNIRARAETLGAALARKAAGEADGYRWLAPAMRPWGAEWLRIVGAHYVAHGPELSNYLAFIENHYRVGALPAPDRLVIDLGYSPVAAAYAECAATAINLPFSVEVRGCSPAPLGTVARMLIRQVAQLGRLAVRWLVGSRPAEAKIGAGGKGIALVGYERGLLQRLPLGTTIDWLEFSRLPPERVVFLFNRSDSPLDEPAREKLSKFGYGWADLSNVSRLDRRAVVGLWRALNASLSMLPRPWDRTGLRRWAVVAPLHPLVHWYRSFLREHRALVLFESNWFAPFQMALNLACRQEQVAVVWSFGSVMLILEQVCRHAFVDLLMAWGDYDVAFCHGLSFDYRYAVEAGVLTNDGREPEDAERAAAIRATLTAKPRFVLAVFDSAHDPRRIHHTPERCAEFYRIVLDLVRKNRDWGCLIKSKATAYEDLPKQPGLQDVVRALEAEGRCVRLPNATKPTLVSLAADAIVCYSVNSAGVQGAIGSGRPVLFYDNNHLFYHPFAFDGLEKSIIRDPNQFSAAIRRLADGEATQGDISRWVPVIDPFVDGLGRKRSGEVIHDYVAARDRGLERDAALRDAVAAFAARYGHALTATRFSTPDTDVDRLWHRVSEKYYRGAPPDFPFTAGTLATPPLTLTDDRVASA